MSYANRRSIARHGHISREAKMRRIPQQIRRTLVGPGDAQEGATQNRLAKRRTRNAQAKKSRRRNR